MTTLTASARTTQDTSPRPVPWRRMAWVTWRQHRIALAGMAAFLGAFAVYLWLSGLGMHHAYAADCNPAGSLGCGMNVTGNYGVTTIIVSIVVQAVPALIGAFVGAPVLARELETGTYRYAWTQGIGRRRWTLGKLVPLAVTVTVTAGAFSALYSWYNQPLFAAGYATPFDARLFDLSGIAFAAWTLAAFAIGVLAGMLIRRVVPAIAATLAVYAGLAATTGLFLRKHYITPLVTNTLNPPGSGWIVSQWYTKNGQYAFPNKGSQIVDAVNQLCPPARIGSDTSPAQCLTQHGYMQWASYQPGSRFWPFQLIESGWLLALSVLLIATTVWLVRRSAI
jgi:ABC-type transport system involved in multi-copper enzyme maturation permease subunit